MSTCACETEQGVVDCRNVGSGEPALKIWFALANESIGKLPRYLYRGVIREPDLVSFNLKTRIVRLRYINASAQKPATRELPIAEFLWRVLHHVLPSGLRRVRDYGFLNGRAKLRLKLVKLVLRVMITAQVQNTKAGDVLPAVPAADANCADHPQTKA